ncbi:MAG: hypothetical protein HFACDABA_01139 [Anaerolineales bacterium]|nr:hypothetical protein [Anaerolineales bacterium]
MPTAEPTLQTLYDALIFDITKAFALPQTNSAQQIVRWLFGRAARRVAELGLGLDREVQKGGLRGGSRWLLPRFAKNHSARGEENIPPAGPLVIASNHPAGIDSIVISAHIPRPDYKVIIGDIPFFENLPHVSEHAIYAPASDQTNGRMRAVRESLRHLKAGGALLIFARGGIEPDPDSMPEPDIEFDRWSRSLEIFLQHVPQTRVLVTMVGGVIARAALKNPLTRLRKLRPDRQRIAFLTQIARQILSGRETYNLTPRVTFGEVIEGAQPRVLDTVHDAARRVLRRHMEWRA